jgi:hypothetical protein
MNTLKSSLILAVAAVLTLAVLPASGATVPAGTLLLVKTTKNIYARDHSGKRISGVLARSIVVGGKTVVPVGADVTGIVKSPYLSVGSTTRPLTLRLTQISHHGRAVTIRSDDVEAENNSPWTAGPRRIQVTGGGAFLLPPGTLLQFHLKHPVEI